MRSLCALAMLMPLAACDEEARPLGPEVISKVEIKTIPIQYLHKVDLLFVIDSAPTMAGEQDSLAANAPVLMEVLGQIEGGLPDIHIAVVSSDMGTMGVDVGDARCEGAVTGMSTFDCGVTGDYLAHEIDEWGVITQNYQAGLPASFACVATSIGATGCPWRQPLAAMQRGLAEGTLNGFLRENAYLAVIFIGDADDCSAADPALYAPASPSAGPRDPFRCFAHGVVCDGFDDPYAPGPRTGCRLRDSGLLRSIDEFRAGLVALKADPRYVLVAAISPTGDVVVEPGPQLADGCSANTNAGTPAIRMREFVQSFVNRNTLTTVCDNDWSDVMIEFSGFGRGTYIGYSCIDGTPVDVDPVTPDLQPEIGAAIIEVDGGDYLYQQLLPLCGDSLPCLRIALVALDCIGTATSLAISLEPPYMLRPRPNSYVEAQILVE